MMEKTKKSPEKARPSARSKALDIVARRRSTGEEVGKKLAKAGYTKEESQDAVSYLISLGYIDDALLARDLAAGLLEKRGWGPAKVAASLMRRGIERNDAARTVKEASLSVDLVEGARAALRKRYGASMPAVGDREWAKKAAGYLFRQGFGYEIARVALRNLGDD